MTPECAYADAVQDESAPTFWEELLRDFPDLLGGTDVHDAAILGIHKAQVARWKSGESAPTVKTLTRVRHRLTVFRLAEKLLAEGQTDTERRPGHKTHLVEKSKTATVTPKVDLPGDIEEAVTMGGRRRAAIWAMTDGLDEQALGWLLEQINKEGWRGLQQGTTKTRDPASS